QHSAMGVIKAELRKSSNVHVVNRDFPSTQICPMCGKLTRHLLSERSYTCSHCGYHHSSRDRKAAISILSEAVKINMLSGTESEESRGGQSLCFKLIMIRYQYWSKHIACEAGSPRF
ncbi:MAG: transposase, partial [Oscillospiraceae bacterium]|nr:transposase [Oscillospiraceae bacterium]